MMNLDSARGKKVNFADNHNVHVMGDSPQRLVPRTPNRSGSTKSIMKKSPRHFRRDSKLRNQLGIPLGDMTQDSGSGSSDSFLPLLSPRVRKMSNSDERSPRVLQAVRGSSGHDADNTPTNIDYRLGNDGWKSQTIDHAGNGGIITDTNVNVHMLKLPGARIFDTIRSPSSRSMEKSASARNLVSFDRYSDGSRSSNVSSSGRQASIRTSSPDPMESGAFHYDARVEHIINKYKVSNHNVGSKVRHDSLASPKPNINFKTAGVQMAEGDTPEMTKIRRKYSRPNALTNSSSEQNLDLAFKFTPRGGGRHSPDAVAHLESSAKVKTTVDSILRSKKAGFNMGAFRMSLDNSGR